jgi:O-antigen/teichoic acid export membrane protein
VVGGVVVLFSFLNRAMTSATQRFLNYALGQNNTEEARNVYSLSFILYAFISLLVIIFAETIGLWFLQTKLNIPAERKDAAFAVYQCSIAAAVIGLLRMPYHAVIVAHEKMSFFALASMIESLLKLGTGFLLAAVNFDHLIVYAVLVFVTGIITFFMYKLYCNKTFETARFRYCGDKKLLRQLAGFSGWNILGDAADVSNTHGTNILINLFANVTVNAAMGIAAQVNLAVFSFAANFQTAFYPQIIKSYAANDRDYFIRLLFQTSKISFYLLFMLVLPLYINAEFVLQLWLKEAPEYTVAFTRLILIFSLVDAIVGPLWMSIQATGNIKKYQIVASGLIFANLPLSFLFLSFGFSPVWVLIIKIALNVITLVWRVYFLCGSIRLPVLRFVRDVIMPVAGISVIASVVVCVVYLQFSGWIRFVVSASFSIICTGCLVYFMGLNTKEKMFLKEWIKRKK